MATFNSMLFLTLLVAISALMAAPSAVKAQRFDNYIINITGTVRCAVSATFFANGSSASRPFTSKFPRLHISITFLQPSTYFFRNQIVQISYPRRPLTCKVICFFLSQLMTELEFYGRVVVYNLFCLKVFFLIYQKIYCYL